MRIAHIIDYYQPQLGYQETYLARARAAMGHDVHSALATSQAIMANGVVHDHRLLASCGTQA